MMRSIADYLPPKKVRTEADTNDSLNGVAADAADDGFEEVSSTIADE